MSIFIDLKEKILKGDLTKVYKNVLKSYGLTWNLGKGGWNFKDDLTGQFLHDGIKDGFIKTTDLNPEFEEKSVVELDLSNTNYSLLKTKNMDYNDIIKKNNGKWDPNLKGWAFNGYLREVGIKLYTDITNGTIKPKLTIEDSLY